MGLTISTSILQSELVKVLKDNYFIDVIIFADDILIYTKEESIVESHNKVVREVFEKLQKIGVKASPEKLQTASKEVVLLGMKLTPSGWRLHEKFTKAVQHIKAPTNIEEIRGFLGLVNWQKQFIPNFSDIALPLYKLLKKDKIAIGVKNCWTDVQQKAFEELRDSMTTDKFLVHPDFDLPFMLCSDASKSAVGATLTQIVNDEKRIIGYYSRRMTPTEVEKDIPEREMLEMIGGLNHFRAIVYGCKITCRVDQKSLKVVKERPPQQVHQVQADVRSF